MGSPFLNDVIDESMWRAICDEMSNAVINNFQSVFRWRVQKGGNQRRREREKHCYVRICVKLSAVHNKATDEGNRQEQWKDRGTWDPLTQPPTHVK